MKRLLILILLSVLSACIVIDTSFTGLNSGYKKLNQYQKSKIKFVNEEEKLSTTAVSDTIYAITSEHITAIIENEKTDVIVYLWSPNCSSSFCYPIDHVQKYCADRNQKLVVVMEYYDFELLNLQTIQNLDYPLFSINTEHYKTDFCNKYTKRFFIDLINDDKVEDEELYNRYFLFKNGKYAGSSANLITN